MHQNDGGETPMTRTAEEAAARIGGGCKTRWLKEKARRREIPFVMIGGAYAFTDAHLDEIIAILSRPAAPQSPRRSAPRRVAPAASPSADLVMLRPGTPRGPRRKNAA